MKTERAAINQQHASLVPLLSRLKDECTFIIENALNQSKIKTHSISSRIKSPDSIEEKIERKGGTASLNKIDDLLGFRIVCLLRSDIQAIGEIIRAQFCVSSEDNKLDGASVEAFGYQSLHFVATLRKDCSGPRYEGLHNQKLEIQVRTVAMDAWATLSHYLDYKSELDAPKNLRKDFFALSGLFHLADTHFEIFYAARKNSSRTAKIEMEESLVDRELNLDNLTAYIQRRFKSRTNISARSASKLLDEILSTNFNSFEKLDAALDLTQQAFLAHEKDSPPNGRKGTKYNDIGIVRISLALLDDKYARSIGYSPINFEKYKKLIAKT